MKRIAFLIWRLANGGAERVISVLATKFVEMDMDVSLITYEYIEGEYPIPSVIKRYYLHDENTPTMKMKRVFRDIRKIRRICRQGKVDTLVCFNGNILYRGILATRFSKTRCVISVRNNPEQLYPDIFNKLVAKILLPFAEGAVFQTEDACNWFPIRLRRKSTIIPNPVDDRFYSVTHDGESGHIVAVARLVEQKNYPMMLRAMRQVVSQIPSCKLDIYGVGPLEERLYQMIVDMNLEQNVRLCGRTDEVERVLVRADVFCMSSDHEGMPNAMMEAMAVGVPCVSTDCPCGGPRYLLGTNGERGLLSPVGDAGAMAKNLITLLCNEQLKQKYSMASKSFAQNFKVERIILQWSDYLYS